MKIGKLTDPNIREIARKLDIQHNVQINVIDKDTGDIISAHEGHNAATNTMMLGIAHYLTGDGILNQAWDMLRNYVPRYMSLGTMGLINQDEDEQGLPAGVGPYAYSDEEARFIAYMKTVPGYGADGYDRYANNNRDYFGLGPVYAARPNMPKVINCELISVKHPRIKITYREIVPEVKAELPETLDIVFSSMVSTGAFAEFREPGRDYIFITEAGMWAWPDWENSSSNGLLAAYRIVPPDKSQWDMSKPENRERLKKEIIKVRRNQVVQIIWKIQIGALSQFDQNLVGNMLRWIEWDQKADYGPVQPWPCWEGPNDMSPRRNVIRWMEH